MSGPAIGADLPIISPRPDAMFDVITIPVELG
jgi:hypothetical protein